VISDFGATKDRLLELLSMTALISVNRKAKAARLTLRPRLERAIKSFDLIKANYDIYIDTDHVPRTLQVGPMLEAELFSVLLNLLSNAIKSVIAAGGEKRLMIAAERRGSEIVINIRDSGMGLKKQYYEEVFSPFSSDPEDRLYRKLDSELNPEDEYIVGTGSGLGLSIAREIIAHRGGTIQFVSPPPGWKADIEVTLP
jgi:signal transduction histidine kinase